MLVIGLAAIAGMEWLMGRVIAKGEDAIEPMVLFLGVVVYAIMANLCYTLGWVIELWGRKMFRAGLLFSCVLTSLPFWFACVYWTAHRGHVR